MLPKPGCSCSKAKPRAVLCALSASSGDLPEHKGRDSCITEQLLPWMSFHSHFSYIQNRISLLYFKILKDLYQVQTDSI